MNITYRIRSSLIRLLAGRDAWIINAVVTFDPPTLGCVNRRASFHASGARIEVPQAAEAATGVRTFDLMSLAPRAEASRLEAHYR